MGEDRIFKDVREVIFFLDGEGFKVAQSSVYRDVNGGRLRREEDGTFAESAVRKYARDFLKLKASGKRVKDDLGDVERRKKEAEARKTEALALQLEKKNERESGKWITREQAALDLAARAGALDNHLRHGIRTKVLDFIGLVNGNPHKAQDLRQALEGWLDEALADYARHDGYVVEFEQPEETGTQCPEGDA